MYISKSSRTILWAALLLAALTASWLSRPALSRGRPEPGATPEPQFHSAVLIDADGDQRPDAVLCLSDRGAVRVEIRFRTGPERQLFTLGAAPVGVSIQAVDVDADNDADLLFESATSLERFIWINDGAGHFQQRYSGSSGLLLRDRIGTAFTKIPSETERDCLAPTGSAPLEGSPAGWLSVSPTPGATLAWVTFFLPYRILDEELSARSPPVARWPLS